MKTIHIDSDLVVKDIESGNFGNESRFVDFVLEYSTEAEKMEAAAMLSLSAKTLSKSTQLAELNKVSDQMIHLVEEIVREFSPDELTKRHEAKAKARENVTKAFLLRRTKVFKAKGLKRSFVKPQQFQLGPIDLELRKGEITGVVGENGNGKTTLFKLMVGELKSTGGVIRYPDIQNDSQILNWNKVKSRIAYVPQVLPAWRGNLLHHLHYEAAIHGIRGDANKRRVQFVVERLGLSDHLGKSWKQLSGGYQFRFALARALVWKPDMMVLDEPLANLDPNAQLRVLRDLKSAAISALDPIAMVLSSQHIHEVEAIADRLVFLSQGKVLFNDLAARFGKERVQNLFEISAKTDLRALRAALPDEANASVSDDGIYFTVSTRREFTTRHLLNALLAASIRVEYFRDISRSSKTLFHKLAS